MSLAGSAAVSRSGSTVDELKRQIRHVPDFPKAGILFYDITTLLKEPQGFRRAVSAMADPHRSAAVDVVVGIESRGFILGAAVAERLHAGFVPVRKPGKLPAATRRASYALEYGTDSLELHEDALTPGQRVLIVDDLLATGGTASAAVGLVRGLGAAVVGVQFLIELVALNGRSRLAGESIGVVLTY
jgi:adenine phosphoribosyltransferase